MSKARLEILTMIAEGKISAEDGERLLAALEEGAAPGGATSAGPTSSSKAKQGARDAAENFGKAVEDAATAVKSAAMEGARAFQRVFDEHRPDTEPVDVDSNEFEIPEGATLRIQPAFRVSIGGSSAGGAVTVRGVPGSKARVLQGSAVEVHRNEDEFVLTWAKSSLVVELPATVAHLFIRGLGGNVSLSDFDGKFRIESFGGNASIVGARSPFKVRSLGGSVRVRDLALQQGLASIRTTGGDIEVSPTEDASVEIQASSTLGGNLVLPKNAVRSASRTRRRGVVVLGDGQGRLSLDTVAGWIRVQADHLESDSGPEEEVYEDTDIRDAAGGAMASAGYSTMDDDDDFPDPSRPTPPPAPGSGSPGASAETEPDFGEPDRSKRPPVPETDRDPWMDDPSDHRS